MLNPFMERELEELREKYSDLTDDEFNKLPEVINLWEKYNEWLGDQ